jgi:hypothetical protein
LHHGEVLGLEWDNVDLGAAELAVGRQLQRVNRQLLHRETKTEASDAILPLPDVCLNALRHRQSQTVEEITANATAADVILEQAQLEALTALRAGDDDS